MKIYRDDIEILDLGFEPDGTEHEELMVEHTVSFSFERAYFLDLEKGDSITFNGEKFYLKENYFPTINKTTGGYVYDLTFYNFIERTKDFHVKYTYQGLTELDFTLTATGGQFADIIISSMSQIGTFTKGEFPAEVNEIQFQNISIFDGLNLIAEAYNTEWWFNGNVLNFSKHEYGSAIQLRYDYELDDVSFSPSSEKLITRLYAFGSTRNLPADYKTGTLPVDTIAEKRLRMPVPYVDLFPNLPVNQIVEGFKIFEDVYPRQENTIVTVDINSSQNVPIYTIKGDNTFILTQSSVISGQALKIAFNTGNLAGREFELIIRDDNKFEIKYVTEGEISIPNSTLKPQVGDKFFFFNFKANVVMPTLVESAELELKNKAQAYLDSIGATYVYNVKTRSIYCETNIIDLGIGQIVSIDSPAIGLITSRIRGYTKQLYNKYECDYIVGDYSKYSRLKEIENLAKSEKEPIDLDPLKREMERYLLNDNNILDESERINLKLLQFQIASQKDSFASDVNSILKSIYIAGYHKDALFAIAEDVIGDSGTIAILNSRINDILLGDGTIPDDYKYRYEKALTAYFGSLDPLEKAIYGAREAIEAEIKRLADSGAGDTQGGGTNELREYDLRFDGKYWNNVGFVEIDFDTITINKVNFLSDDQNSWADEQDNRVII